MADDRPCPHCGSPIPPDAPSGGLCPKCLLRQGFVSQTPTRGPGAEGRPGAPDPASIAHLFPQYDILDLVGQGGMGAVYTARQKNLDRLVALKILTLDAARGPAFSERFIREARTLARLNHPNIVAIHDFGEAEGLYYFVMEYVDGASLREVLQSGKLSPKQALAIIPQICEALQFAHDEGIVHRDIKPENILLDEKGRVKIADFGLAKLIQKQKTDFTLTEPGQVMGTPTYMAPEQIEKPWQVDHRADIFSLGVVFYEMLTGELPLGRFAPPSQKFQMDVRLDEVVLRTLEKEPQRRYQHASEVKTDVESIDSGLPVAAAVSIAGIGAAQPPWAPSPPPSPSPQPAASPLPAPSRAGAPSPPPGAAPFPAATPPPAVSIPPTSTAASTGQEAPAPSTHAEKARRPRGVTWVAIYAFLNAAWLLSGEPFAGIGALWPNWHTFRIPFALRVVLALWSLLTGLGLLSLERWARISALVLAGFGLLFFPLGTLVSTIILIYLLRRKTARVFQPGAEPMIVAVAKSDGVERAMEGVDRAMGKVTDVVEKIEGRIRGRRSDRKPKA